MKKEELRHIRINLYSEYVDELRAYDPVINNMTSNDIIRTVDSYLMEDELNLGEWIDIKTGDKIVGFVIISRSMQECHPDADYEICQTFVNIEYRRQGLTKQTVVNYLSSHPGIVAFDILIGNYKANMFWNNVFKNVDAHYMELPEVRKTDVVNYAQLYGYKVKKHETKTDNIT